MLGNRDQITNCPDIVLLQMNWKLYLGGGMEKITNIVSSIP